MKQQTLAFYIAGLAILTVVFALASLIVIGTVHDPEPIKVAFSRRPETTRLKTFHHISFIKDGSGKIKYFNNRWTNSDEINDTLLVIEQTGNENTAALTCPADAKTQGLSFEVVNDTLNIRLTIDTPSPKTEIDFSTLSPIVVTLPTELQLQSVTALPSCNVFTAMKNISTPRLAANIAGPAQLTHCNIGNLSLHPVTTGDDNDNDHNVTITKFYGLDDNRKMVNSGLKLGYSIVDSMTIVLDTHTSVSVVNGGEQKEEPTSAVGALAIANASDSTLQATLSVGLVKTGSLTISPTIECETDFTTTTTTRFTVGKECNPQNLRK